MKISYKSLPYWITVPRSLPGDWGVTLEWSVVKTWSEQPDTPGTQDNQAGWSVLHNCKHKDPAAHSGELQKGDPYITVAPICLFQWNATSSQCDSSWGSENKKHTRACSQWLGLMGNCGFLLVRPTLKSRWCWQSEQMGWGSSSLDLSDITGEGVITGLW